MEGERKQRSPKPRRTQVLEIGINSLSVSRDTESCEDVLNIPATGNTISKREIETFFEDDGFNTPFLETVL